VAIATVNATFDWVASESKRVLREVLQVREKERRLEVTPPVACARPIEAAARDDGDKATDPYDDIGDDVDLGAGATRSKPRAPGPGRGRAASHAAG
jgi:hypothetical protein